VLTATDSPTATIAAATLTMESRQATVTAGPTSISFRMDELGGDILIDGARRALGDKVTGTP